MYEHWLDFVKRSQIPTTANLLDLACGSGRQAVKLKQAGYQHVTGLDLSEEMLALAAMHAQDAQLDLPLIAGNMLNLQDLPLYDCVVCFADSLCYLVDEAEVQQAMLEVCQHLNAGGKFLFDVITPYQTDVGYADYMYNYQDEKTAFMWESYHGDVPASVIHELTFFVRDNDGRYEKLTETHYQRTYSLDKYRAMLKHAGFKHVHVSADFGRTEPQADTNRWFFVCEK